MPNTSGGLPYPAGSDVPDVPGDMQALAEAVDSAITTAQSNATNASVPKSIVDAKGDLIVGTADNTVGRVQVGANGTFLQADSAQAAGVRWQSISNPGLVFIGDTAISGTTVNVNNIFTSAYAHYRILFIGTATVSSGSIQASFRLRTGTTNLSSSYDFSAIGAGYTSFSVNNNSVTNGTDFTGGMSQGSTSGALMLSMDILNPQAAANKFFMGSFAGPLQASTLTGRILNTTQYDGLSISSAALNVTYSGTLSVWAYSKV